MRRLRLLVFAFSALWFSACSTFQRTAYFTEQPTDQETELATVVLDGREASSAVIEVLQQQPYESTFSPIRLDYNRDVQRWLDYFQGRGARHMRVYLSRASRYRPLMQSILREYSLPEDLFYIALIESGFSPTAYSHASAVGYWQFIRGTAVRYGLRIDGHVDERRDPVLSTRAAAEYFRALYSLFGDWHLAMAGYNTGENRVQRLLLHHRTRDFWELARVSRLPRETKNYVPKYIAAAMIAKDPAKYGFVDVEYQAPIAYETFKLEQPISLRTLAQNMAVEYQELRSLNPMYRGDYVPISSDRETFLRVPQGQVQAALAAVPQSFSEAPRVVHSDYEMYRVRRGDTLSHIARRYRTNVATLRRLNNLGQRNMIRVGQRLRVPVRGGAVVPASQVASTSQRAQPAAASRGGHVATASAGPVYHQVRRGENLTVIARRYGVSVNELLRLNNLSTRSILRVGDRLKIREGVVEGSSYHIVRRGENLTSIARRYNTTVQELSRVNGIQSRSVIRVGQRLQIPGSRATVHRVRRGETLSQIARRYNVTTQSLAAANEINNRSRIMAGAELVIPQTNQ